MRGVQPIKQGIYMNLLQIKLQPFYINYKTFYIIWV